MAVRCLPTFKAVCGMRGQEKYHVRHRDVATVPLSETTNDENAAKYPK